MIVQLIGAQGEVAELKPPPPGGYAYAESICMLCKHVVVHDPPLTEAELNTIIAATGGRCAECGGH